MSPPASPPWLFSAPLREHGPHSAPRARVGTASWIRGQLLPCTEEPRQASGLLPIRIPQPYQKKITKIPWDMLWTPNPALAIQPPSGPSLPFQPCPSVLPYKKMPLQPDWSTPFSCSFLHVQDSSTRLLVPCSGPSLSSFSRASFPLIPPRCVSGLFCHPCLFPPHTVLLGDLTPVACKTQKSISLAEISVLSLDVSTWPSHRHSEVIVSKSELLLPSKPLSDSTVTHQDTGHQPRLPPLCHSPFRPLGSIHLAPHPEAPPWSKPPGHSPAGTCRVAFLLKVLCPFNPFPHSSQRDHSKAPM